MRSSRALVGFMALFLTSACSLDNEYFDPRRVSEYKLDTDLDVEEIEFSSNGETLYAVYAPAPAPDANTISILYFHGDDQDIDKFLPRLERLAPINGGNVNLFIFDFQGYGKSTGSPSLAAIHQNSIDALATLLDQPEVNPELVVYYAFSLGGIFASRLAAETAQPFAFIGEAIPASSDRVIRGSLGFGFPSSFLFNETFNASSDLKKLTSPALLIHGDKDGTVPFKDHAPTLFKIVEQNSELSQTQKVIGAGHSNVIETIGPANYVDLIDDFLGQL